jgi:hypothetical protein
MNTFDMDFLTRIEAARKRLKKILITGFLLFFVCLLGVLYILSLFDPQKMHPLERFFLLALCLAALVPLGIYFTKLIRGCRVSREIERKHIFSYLKLSQDAAPMEIRGSLTGTVNYPVRVFNRKLLLTCTVVLVLMGAMFGALPTSGEDNTLLNILLGTGAFSIIALLPFYLYTVSFTYYEISPEGISYFHWRKKKRKQISWQDLEQFHFRDFDMSAVVLMGKQGTRINIDHGIPDYPGILWVLLSHIKESRNPLQLVWGI